MSRTVTIMLLACNDDGYISESDAKIENVVAAIQLVDLIPDPQIERVLVFGTNQQRKMSLPARVNK